MPHCPLSFQRINGDIKFDPKQTLQQTEQGQKGPSWIVIAEPTAEVDRRRHFGFARHAN